MAPGPRGYSGSTYESRQLPGQLSDLGWINERVNWSTEQAKVIFEGLKATVDEGQGEGEETESWLQDVRGAVGESRAELNKGLDSLEEDVIEGIRALPKHKRAEAGREFAGRMSVLNTIINAIREAITAAWNWIKSTATRVWSTLKGIWDTVTGLFS